MQIMPQLTCHELRRMYNRETGNDPLMTITKGEDKGIVVTTPEYGAWLDKYLAENKARCPNTTTK